MICIWGSSERNMILINTEFSNQLEDCFDKKEAIKKIEEDSFWIINNLGM